MRSTYVVDMPAELEVTLFMSTASHTFFRCYKVVEFLFLVVGSFNIFDVVVWSKFED